MPLELEATPGADDANAYADEDTAEEYAGYRVGGAAFIALESDQKIQALVTATRDIDTLADVFIGERATDDQALEWPRSGTNFGDDELPDNLVNATIELAMSYVPAFASGSTVDVLNADPSDGLVKREKLDVIETEWFEPRAHEADSFSRFPAAVQRLLAPLVELPVEGEWGAATVERGS